MTNMNNDIKHEEYEKHEFTLYSDIRGRSVNKWYSDWRCNRGHDLCEICGYCHICLFKPRHDEGDFVGVK
jgi:hypothetical protein